ncbi:restriction endonuclease subunit S [Streptomyces sp. NPDC094034]|uniref:restriction endonuclease subunit S n=1 Tax=Streptomyces sp. NPDC094034 TaxID=3155309 RepID=UPI00332F1049
MSRRGWMLWCGSSWGDWPMQSEKDMTAGDFHIPRNFGSLPDGWRWSPLGSVCVGVFDCPHSTPKLTTTGPFVIRTQDISSGILRLDSAARVSSATYAERIKRAEPTYGDLLYSREGTYFGIAAEVPKGVQVCLGQRMVLIRPDRQVVHHRFMRYWLNSPTMSAHIHGYRDGSVAERLNLTTIRALPTLLPPVREQEVIAGVLGALDDKIAINERIAVTVLDLAESRYRAASEDGNWRTVTLGSAARWLSGGTPRTSESSYWGGEIPWISALSLKSPWIDNSDRKLTDLGAASGTRLVPTESIIFVVRGSSLKSEFRIGITQCNVAFGQDCKALIPDGSIDPHLLFHAIRSAKSEIMEMVDETSIGAGRLSTDLISKLEVRVPKERDESTAAELRTLSKLAAGRQKESRTLAALRDALLPQLMSGKLRVRDAEKIVEDAV